MHIGPAFVVALLGQAIRAHPGHDVHHEAALRRHYLSLQANNLDHCDEMLKAEGVQHRAVERRSARVAELSPYIYGMGA